MNQESLHFRAGSVKNIRNLLGTIFQLFQTDIIFIISGIITDAFEGTRVAILHDIRRIASPYFIKIILSFYVDLLASYQDSSAVTRIPTVWSFRELRFNLVSTTNPYWQTIMILEFNPTDHERLTQRRIKRLAKLFIHPLGLCNLEVKRDRLIVHCTEAWMIDSLMDDLDYISEAARIILGAKVISLFFAKEEICQTATEPRLPIAS